MAAVVRPSPQIKSNFTCCQVKQALRDIASPPPRVAGNDCGIKSAARRWDHVPPPFCTAEFDSLARRPHIKQISTKMHLTYGTPAGPIDVAADATLWEVF